MFSDISAFLNFTSGSPSITSPRSNCLNQVFHSLASHVNQVEKVYAIPASATCADGLRAFGFVWILVRRRRDAYLVRDVEQEV